ncbi:MAG TPA: hypothetical protein VF199_01215, partial [Bacillales bacterium]
YHFPENAGSETVYILAGIPWDEWPQGAKLIVSPEPEPGGPFQIKKKEPLKYRLQKSEDAPMLQYVNIEHVYLAKAYPVGESNGLAPVIMSGETPIVSKGRYQGAKTVLFSFDIQDSDWPLHPSFPILVQNTLAYLSSQDETLGYFFPGEREQITLAPTTRSAKIETAEGRDVSALDLKQPVLKVPNKPGLYKLSEQTSNGLRTRYFAVMADESELSARSAKSFSLIPGDTKETNGTKMVQHELWRWAAALALLVLFVEWEVYRRGTTGR